jgi:hypothetical protein
VTSAACALAEAAMARVSANARREWRFDMEGILECARKLRSAHCISME